jgi:glycosyltransferase involved in cell wall biosynthesis
MRSQQPDNTRTEGSGPKFSIVTVVRDDCTGLTHTWDSIALQSFREFEWIVVDGASTDGTTAWLSELKDERVTWRSEPDDGIYDAMNKGTAMCTGDVVLYLNAGDALAASSVLADVAESWTLSRWPWAYGLGRVISPDGRLLAVWTNVPFRRKMLELGYRSMLHQACYFGRDLLRTIGPYLVDFGVTADQELCYRAALQAEPQAIPEVVADFASGGASWQRRPDAFVWAARRFRSIHGTRVLNSRVADLLVTVILAADRWLRFLVSRRLAGRSSGE